MIPTPCYGWPDAAWAPAAAQMIRDALKESELSMQSKLHDLAHAVLEEQQTGAQQRMIDAIKGKRRPLL